MSFVSSVFREKCVIAEKEITNTFVLYSLTLACLYWYFCVLYRRCLVCMCYSTTTYASKVEVCLSYTFVSAVKPQENSKQNKTKQSSERIKI